MADDETLKLRRDGAVAVLELARPAAAHALDPGLARALADAATALDADDRVRAEALAQRLQAFRQRRPAHFAP